MRAISCPPIPSVTPLPFFSPYLKFTARALHTIASRDGAALIFPERLRWTTSENRKKSLENIGRRLGVKQLEDWYLVTRRDFTRHGGSALFAYHSTLREALASIYPEYPWKGERFTENGNVPPGYWKEKHNLLNELGRIESVMGIKKPEDWYSVTLTDLRDLGFPQRVSRTALADLLEQKYPHHAWERVRLLRGRLAQQHRLENAIATLFPGLEIKHNVRKEADLINPESRDYLELDIFIPALNLALEYHEHHHYTSSLYTYHPVDHYRTRDEVKKRLAESKGITLVTVPFWWDGQQESLVATIRSHRPDLLIDTPSGIPIQEEPPPYVLERHKPHVEGIGEPTTACFFSLSKVDPTNWWIFEKYDGIRAFWNPEKRAFYSRNGTSLALPTEIIKSMPDDIFLDGELWFGRNKFQEAMKIVSRTSISDWTAFKFMVFDVPTHPGTYRERYERLVDRLTGGSCKYVQLAEYVQCNDEPHLEQVFQDIIDKGGEGIILRDPMAPIQPGRSPGYLKHKKFRDAEARIIACEKPNEWECELPNGVRFTAVAATSEFARRWKPRSGDIVSFKHHGYLLASKKPKFPTLYRLRTELSWGDVVQNWKGEKPRNTSALSVRRLKSKRKPNGYWADSERRRAFFVAFARERGFDPLVAENWVPRMKIVQKKAPWTFSRFGSVKKALERTFPELQHKFVHRSHSTTKAKNLS